MGYAQHGEAWREPGAAAGWKVRTQIAHLGSGPAPASAGDRSRRGTTDGAGVTAVARSEQELWVCWSGAVAEGSVVSDLDVVSRGRRKMGGTQGDRDSRGAGGSGRLAAAAEGVQGGAAAGVGHQFVAG